MFRRLLVVLLLASAALTGATPADAAPVFVPVTGVGSSWSANAIHQWRRNVDQYGMTINYEDPGSTEGRNQFRLGKADFGVSEIPYGLNDAGTGSADPPPPRGFAYMPIVAGGTSFMYNLKIGNNRVTNLRLSGENVVKIFTGVITSWDDKAIRVDNPQLALPARKIVPVYRSDGSGTTAQFTLWMSKEYPALWNDYCRRSGRNTPCGLTSSYPAPANFGVGKANSTGVASFVKQSSSEGAITYVEYSYAVNNNFPVAKVLNKGGYYVEPTAKAVAVALTYAGIDKTPGPNYLTQQLDEVYRNDDKRTYPLSSYSYMILPTRLEYGITENKGYTIAAFSYYFLCEGQQQADSLGYSPLPINLVKAGLEQVTQVPGAARNDIVLSKCNNPTFSPDGTNTLAKNAPNPPECDHVGTVQCATGTGGAKAPTPVTRGGGTAGGTGSAAPGAPGGSGAPGAADGAGGAGGGGDTNVAGSAGDVNAIPVSLEADGGWRLRHTMMVLAGVLLLMVIVGPPLLARRIQDGSS
ncbi:phosphate ABC transporter substrate-binding protein PstS [Longispora urticae]